MIWRVGQKVVCVNHFRNCAARLGIAAPVKDGIYTIRGIDQDEESVAFLFEEFVNGSDFYRLNNGTVVFGEPMFKAWNFRPLVEHENDISVFTRILDAVSRKVREEVQ